MNRSCLIILELLKLSYCNRACKSSIKNSLKQILITKIKPLSLQKKKTQRFTVNKNWFDKIPSDRILSNGNGYCDKKSFL